MKKTQLFISYGYHYSYAYYFLTFVYLQTLLDVMLEPFKDAFVIGVTASDAELKRADAVMRTVPCSTQIGLLNMLREVVKQLGRLVDARFDLFAGLLTALLRAHRWHTAAPDVASNSTVRREGDNMQRRQMAELCHARIVEIVERHADHASLPALLQAWSQLAEPEAIEARSSLGWQQLAVLHSASRVEHLVPMLSLIHI